MSLPEKVTFRPGKLAGAMESQMSKDAIGASELIRRALAEYLGRKPPKMDGHVKTINRVNRERRKRSQDGQFDICQKCHLPCLGRCGK